MVMDTRPQILEIEMHNSSSRMRKRCRWRWSLQEVGMWRPRRRSAALWVGSAIDRALKAYYETVSRQRYYDIITETPDVSTPHDVQDWSEPFQDLDAAATAGWAALEAYLTEVASFDKPQDTVDDHFEELSNLAREMWITYLAELDRVPDAFEVIVMDRQFKGFLGIQTVLGTSCSFYYAGEFDGLILMNGKLYIFENKTSGMPEQLINSLDRDEQSSRYHWAVKRMVAAGAFEHLGIPRDMEVWGTLFNVLYKRVPKPVAVNKPVKGISMLSKVVGNHKLEDYIEALKEVRPYKWEEKAPRGSKKMPTIETGRMGDISPWIPEADAALLDEWNNQHVPAIIKLDRLPWVRRIEVDRNPSMLAQTETQLWAECMEEAELRIDPNRVYRNPTFQCSIDCPVLEVCNMHLRGMPIQAYLEEFFVRKGEEGDPYDGTVTDVPELVDDDGFGEF